MTLGVKRGRKIKGGKITENMWIDRGYRERKTVWEKRDYRCNM